MLLNEASNFITFGKENTLKSSYALPSDDSRLLSNNSRDFGIIVDNNLNWRLQVKVYVDLDHKMYSWILKTFLA